MPAEATIRRYCVRDDEGRLLPETLADSISLAIRALRRSDRAPPWAWYCRVGFRVVKADVRVSEIEGTDWPPKELVGEEMQSGGE